MPRIPIRTLSLIIGLPLLAAPARASKVKPADFPLRVHVFSFTSIRHYHGSFLQEVDGIGQANLFENGQPRGFDFTYQCGQPITPELGFETLMARWKKPGREIEILMPSIGGKPGAMDSCDLKVTLKESTAYYRGNGRIGEEPAAAFKDWMIKHKYDPEHGMNQPVRMQTAQPVSGSTHTQ